MDTIRVVLANDHPIVGAGVHILEEARHLFEDLAPDILLIEMTFADERGSAPQAPAAPTPAAPRVFVLRSHHSRAYVFGLLASESHPMLTEQDALDAIGAAVQASLDGTTAGRSHRIVAKVPAAQLEGPPAATPQLTAREADVLRQLSTGKSDRDIAQHLGISVSTVHYHLKNIYRKLQIKRRSEVIAWAARSGW